MASPLVVDTAFHRAPHHSEDSRSGLDANHCPLPVCTLYTRLAVRNRTVCEGVYVLCDGCVLVIESGGMCAVYVCEVCVCL